MNNREIVEKILGIINEAIASPMSLENALEIVGTLSDECSTLAEALSMDIERMSND